MSRKASSKPANARAAARKTAGRKERGSEQAPMGAHPPEDPHLDDILVQTYMEVQPPGFRDNPESAVKAADIDVEDTIGGE